MHCTVLLSIAEYCIDNESMSMTNLSFLRWLWTNSKFAYISLEQKIIFLCVFSANSLQAVVKFNRGHTFPSFHNKHTSTYTTLANFICFKKIGFSYFSWWIYSLVKENNCVLLPQVSYVMSLLHRFNSSFQYVKILSYSSTVIRSSSTKVWIFWYLISTSWTHWNVKIRLTLLSLSNNNLNLCLFFKRSKDFIRNHCSSLSFDGLNILYGVPKTIWYCLFIQYDTAINNVYIN